MASFVFPKHGEDHGGGHEAKHGSAEHGSAEHGSSEHGVTDGHRRLHMAIWTGSRRLGESIEGGSCNIELAQEIAGACRAISLAILFFFAIELVIKFLIAPKAFCKHVGHLFDTCVIFGSIVLEFTLHHSAGGLLIFFRTWRFVRVIHALYEQAEYFHNAMETEEHLEKALATIGKYKSYTSTKGLRADWKAFNKKAKKGAADLEQSELIDPHDDSTGKPADVPAASEISPPGVPHVLPLT